jgi:hypothetical protein
MPGTEQSAEQSAKEPQTPNIVVASLYQWQDACFYANQKRSIIGARLEGD